jgi:hypothetical protein
MAEAMREHYGVDSGTTPQAPSEQDAIPTSFL